MAFVGNETVAMCAVNFIMDGQNVQNTLYFQSAVEIDATNILQLASDLSGYWQNNQLARQSSAVLMTVVEAKQMLEMDPFVGTWLPVGTTTGALSPVMIPNNGSFAVSFRTSTGGRSGRGRNFWLGIPEDQTTQSRLNAGYITNILSEYNGMVGADAVSSGWTWCVYSRFSGGIPRVFGAAYEIIAAVAVDDIVDSQRRRLPGRGR